jgi:HSP90 family molecular chaperone
MNKAAHFRVDPKLTQVLGENYTSSEKALKELIDNAWDAEATEVHVTVPNILTEAPIIVRDNGSGMKTAELEAEYLNIASPRFSRKGDRTPNLNRIVKGRKGIGKFAGLILASEMELVTQAAGKRTRVLISKTALLDAIEDLEKVPLPLDVGDAEPSDAKGTAITLRNLNPKLSHIQPDKLKELLAFDYGRETDFAIFVNGERVFHHDIQGEKFQQEVTLPNGMVATGSYTIAEKPLPGKKAGLIVRVGGKSIGKPHLFGLENDDALSDRLRRRIVGEINW